MDHLTEQDAGLLEQAASMLEGLANDERNRGNCSSSEGAACSAHAIRRLAPAMLRAGRGCLAQIEEPAQPVAEICSASHDDAQFGERAIKPLCDISGFEYGTPLYAGAAPAAVAPEHPPMPETWAVVASIEGQDVVCISSNALSGKGELTESEEQAVIGMAQHLLAFVGYGLPPCDFDADDEPAPAPALEAPAAPPVPVDEFRGDTPSLVRNIVALLELDADGALVPHGVGGHARGLLSAAAARLAAAPQAPAAPVLVGDGQADAYLADPGRLETLARSHPAGLVRALARAAMAAPAAPAEGEVLVEVIGLTGSGKSAICGEIEILCRALGLDVSWPDGDPEKNMTHAEWTAAIEAYKPRVRIVERNVPRQSNGGPAK